MLNRTTWKESMSDFVTNYNYKWSNSRKGTDFSLFKNQQNHLRVSI
jgi:hypothetical protein